jgi:hypothetical protein
MTLEHTTRNALGLLAAIGTLAWGSVSTIRSARGLQKTGSDPMDVTVRSIELSSPRVKAGARVTATVTLTGPARSPAGAVVVYIGFDTEVLAGPTMVRIPNGQTSGTFTLYSKPLLRALERRGAISASTASPEPYRLITGSVTVVAARSTTAAPLGMESSSGRG